MKQHTAILSLPIRRGNKSRSTFEQQFLTEYNWEFKIFHKWPDTNSITHNFRF